MSWKFFSENKLTVGNIRQSRRNGTTLDTQQVSDLTSDQKEARFVPVAESKMRHKMMRWIALQGGTLKAQEALDALDEPRSGLDHRLRTFRKDQ